VKLKKYLPSFIGNSKIFSKIYEIEQSEIDDYNNLIEDLVNQCFVEKATWGLSLWEDFLDIKANLSSPEDFRRSAIKAKLRGQGVVTVDLIKNVSESFSNGDVEITENIEPYTFEIKFVGTRGIPPNLEGLKKAIEDIKPAHLSIKYKFTYMTWDEFESYNRTWDQWEELNLTWDEFEKYRE